MLKAARSGAILDVDGVLARAEALVPVLREKSAAINESRMVPADVMAMLYANGLMQLAKPERYGGPDTRVDVIFEVARILAQGDGSTAWVYGVTSSHDHLIGLYPEQVQDQYWGSEHPLCASSYLPQGKPTRVQGGYRLTGNWSFCSGIDHCDWIVVGSLIFEEGRPPSLGLFLVPKSDLTVVDDWHVMGLAGTGSKSVVLEDVFIPDERLLHNEDVMAGNTPGKALHANPLYGTSIWILFGFSILAPSTGLARGAYDTLVADYQKRAASGDPMFNAKKASAGMRLAEIGAIVDSAELLFSSNLRETAEMVSSGQPVSLEIRTRNRRNQAFIAKICRQAMDSMMQLSGGHGLQLGAPIQRAMRDLYAVSAHPGGNQDAAFTSYGSVLLGGDPTEPFC